MTDRTIVRYHEDNIEAAVFTSDRTDGKTFVWIAIAYQDYEPSTVWGVFLTEAEAVAKIRELQGDGHYADHWYVDEFPVEGALERGDR